MATIKTDNVQSPSLSSPSIKVDPTTGAITFPDGVVNLPIGFRTQATANSTLALVVGDAGLQEFTGTTPGQIVQMPDVTTLGPNKGWSSRISNKSTQPITVNSSGGNLIFTVPAGTDWLFTCNAITGTTAASWSNSAVGKSVDIVDISSTQTLTNKDLSSATNIFPANYSAGKNKILNGDMAIDQRNNGSAQTISAGANVYTIDRWIAFATTGAVTGQRVAGSGNCRYRYQFTGGASNAAIYFLQRIEKANAMPMAGGNVTLSVDLANSLLTTVTWTLVYPTADDNFSSLTTIATGTFTINSTVTRYSTTIAVPAAATTGLQVMLNVGAQTSGTWTIGNAQLEIGSVATAFQTATGNPASELAACKRYLPSAVGSSTYMGYAYGTNLAAYDIPFSTTARVAPTGITVIGSITAYALNTGYTVVPTFDHAGVDSAQVLASPTITAGQGSRLDLMSGTIFFDGCEL